MQTQPVRQTPIQPTGCCPPFDPASWQEKQVVWHEKAFVVDHVHSVLHVPLDFGTKVVRNQRRIEAAGASPEHPLMLTDETSAWGADMYLDVTKPVEGARMASLSGTFLTKVYEGPYRNAPRWAEDMSRYVASKGRKLEKVYFAYTTCPRCAKAYGKNYVVLFAKVAE